MSFMFNKVIYFFRYGRDKINYYLDIAESVLKRATCLRRHYGAIIVKNDEIISTGYNRSTKR